jgi:hypothetical protein
MDFAIEHESAALESRPHRADDDDQQSDDQRSNDEQCDDEQCDDQRILAADRIISPTSGAVSLVYWQLSASLYNGK